MDSSCVSAARARDWSYKAEGGRNLVVSYGGGDSGLAGHVLRLHKRRRAEVGDGVSHEEDSSSSGWEHDGTRGTECEEAFRYMDETFSPILRRDLLLMGRLVAVGAPFLAELAVLCEPFRPRHRAALEIDRSARSGWLMPDLCTLPGTPSVRDPPPRL